MPITETTIHTLATAQSFERGRDYYRSGAVVNLQKRENNLRAQVEGSRYEPYEVTVELSEGGLVEADCTCPYDLGGYCKHIVAALLTYIHQPEQVTERPPVTDLLADLDRAELLDLLTELLSEQPRLVDWVERQLATQSATLEARPGQPYERQTQVDSEAFAKQAQYILNSGRGYGRDYWDGGSAVSEIRDLADEARPFIEAGDGRNALRILEPVTAAFVDSWYEVDYEGQDSAMLFADLGQKLTEWQGEIDDYGIDGAFDVAIAAAEQGWDYPPLQKVLQDGEITEKGAWEGEAPWYADELAVARLNVLERQDRTTEYLYLAEAEGQTALYLTMLVKLDRIEEAVKYARKYVATTDEALALAKALREHNQPLKAIEIAEHGLNLHGEVLILARWLRDFAMAISQPDVALRAARAAFIRSTSLEDYQVAQAVAEAEWSKVKRELLDQLADTDYSIGKIDIYLHEGMIDEAVKTIDQDSYVGFGTLERVVEAAYQSHPDWVIRHCKRQAERIMDAGKSQHYHHAIRWLEWARKAYLAANRAQEWQTYLDSLIEKHTRKYSLRPQLEDLRDAPSG